MIGVDIADVSRIKSAMENPAFTERVFTAAEREYCNSRPRPDESFAGIFCAKEAAVKCIKRGFGTGIMPKDIEILHAPSGAPKLVAHGRAAEFFGERTDVSVSHDGGMAIAVVQITEE